MTKSYLTVIGTSLVLLAAGRARAQEGGQISDQNMIFILPIQPDAPTWGLQILRPSYTTTTGSVSDLSETNIQGWFYRVTGDTRENCFNSAGGASQEIDGNRIVVHQLYDGWNADQAWEVTSTGATTGDLTATLTLSNTSETDLNISIFYYADIDVAGTFTDTARLTRDGAIQVRDRTGPLYALFSAATANAYQVTPWATLLSELTDFEVNELDNSGLPLHGDFTGGYEWILVVPAGAATTISAKIEWKQERRAAPAQALGGSDQ